MFCPDTLRVKVNINEGSQHEFRRMVTAGQSQDRRGFNLVHIIPSAALLFILDDEYCCCVVVSYEHGMQRKL